MYGKQDFINDSLRLFAELPGNIVDIPGAGSTQLFDEPLIGFASASDELFESFRQPEAIGPVFRTPAEWLEGAGTVISFFFPFSEEVSSSNIREEAGIKPSVQWLYARIEGQDFINRFITGMSETVSRAGLRCCIPSLDERFKVKFELVSGEGGRDFHTDSMWSERHAAYACGLGTFGLSRGLITAKGMSGRFTSIIIDAEFEPDTRDYEGIYDYCIRCGACAANCPVKAISLEHGKNNRKCNNYVEATRKMYAPRYGCGKCQVGVPCEHGIPGR